MSTMPKLTEEMRSALAKSPGRPLRVEDDISQAHYVMIPAETYDRSVGLIGPDVEIDSEESIEAIAEALFTPECWDAPGMELYDNYDANRSGP